MKTYRIIDILHTGHHGPAGVSKKGSKYDKRRGQFFMFDDKNTKIGDTAIFWHLLDNKTASQLPFLFTTAYEGIERKDDKVIIKTLNSHYIVEEVNP